MRYDSCSDCRLPFADQRMTIPFGPFSTRLPSLNITAIVDILVVAFLIYQAFMLIRGRRSAQLVAGILVFLLIYLSSVQGRAI